MKKPFAITLDVRTSLANHTGSWRTERPVYFDGLPPCNHACPAGEQVQGWLYAAEDGGYETAWRRLVNDNPFPAIMGRVCYHPCETACNRAELDSAVGINSVERFLGDEAIKQGWELPAPGKPTGRKVLVVGAGPCGLAAAYHLRRLGHEVEIRDAGSEPGGMMRYGIPAFRLPRDVLDIEIARLLALGITLKLNTQVDDLAAAMQDGGFDAALLAMGAQLSKRAYIPAGQSAQILDALKVLGDVADGERPQLGRTVIVYGGGNTAMDVARTARRLGAEEAIIVYRRTQAQMPANELELEEALAEGVQMRWLRTITQVEGNKLTIEKMELDEHGKPHPTGEYEELAGDAVVLALGQDVDRSMLDTLPEITLSDGVVEVGPDMMTGRPGVFAGGDMAPAERSVTVAVGHGKRVARSIDAWLHNQPAPVDANGAEPVGYDKLNSWYYSDAPHAMRPRLEVGRRVADFGEVVKGLDEETALYEARRCMSCGNCFGCDNCFGVCPDNAVIKVGADVASQSETPLNDMLGSHAPLNAHGYAIDYDYCKGCGLCAAECPCGAIIMEPEQR
jgi:NADPH-dependent glutamate synthase beta subunit-like oxidoreductase